MKTLKKTDLLQSFVEALMHKSSTKTDLVSFVADTLHIEKESASRRITGKVQFTIREMGILAQEMDISLDSLLNANNNYTPIFFKMDIPRMCRSIDELIAFIQRFAEETKSLTNKNIEMGTVFNSLPIEFYIRHPHLCKFMYFKWGHYFMGGSSFNSYAEWELSEKLISIHQDIINNYKQYKVIYYLWDKSVIWNLANDIKYFSAIFALTPQDTEQIKKELHQMLYELEEAASGQPSEHLLPNNVNLYVTSLNIGLTGTYLNSEDTFISLFSTYFFHSNICKDYVTGKKVKQWIESLKKVSAPISGGGEKERRLFFEEQHQIVNQI